MLRRLSGWAQRLGSATPILGRCRPARMAHLQHRRRHALPRAASGARGASMQAWTTPSAGQSRARSTIREDGGGHMQPLGPATCTCSVPDWGPFPDSEGGGCVPIQSKGSTQGNCGRHRRGGRLLVVAVRKLAQREGGQHAQRVLHDPVELLQQGTRLACSPLAEDLGF